MNTTVNRLNSADSAINSVRQPTESFDLVAHAGNTRPSATQPADQAQAGTLVAQRRNPDGTVQEPGNVTNIRRPSQCLEPQAYWVGASLTLPSSLQIGNVTIGKDSKVLVAMLANGDEVREGDLMESVRRGTAFISFTPPNGRSAYILTGNPSTGNIEFRRGLPTQVFGSGPGKALAFANAGGGVTGLGGDEMGTVTGNVGVGIKVPFTQTLGNMLINGARGLGTAAAVSSGAGAGTVGAINTVANLLTAVNNKTDFWVGAAYQGRVNADTHKIQIQGLNNNREMTYGGAISETLSCFAFDPRNFGSTDIAFGKTRFLLENGTSYFQLSATSNHWVNGGESVEFRNHGERGLGLVNYINQLGMQFGLLDSRVGNQTVDGRYVRLWDPVDSGQDMINLVTRLKSQLQTSNPAQWQQIEDNIERLAAPLGFNLGLPFESRLDPNDGDAVAINRYMRRDWNKQSVTQEIRTVERVPPGIVQ